MNYKPLGFFYYMTTTNIAKRAYEIWETSGRPEGRDTEHWLQAEKEASGRGKTAAAAALMAPAASPMVKTPRSKRVLSR